MRPVKLKERFNLESCLGNTTMPSMAVALRTPPGALTAPQKNILPPSLAVALPKRNGPLTVGSLSDELQKAEQKLKKTTPATAAKDVAGEEEPALLQQAQETRTVGLVKLIAALTLALQMMSQEGVAEPMVAETFSPMGVGAASAIFSSEKKMNVERVEMPGLQKPAIDIQATAIPVKDISAPKAQRLLPMKRPLGVCGPQALRALPKVKAPLQLTMKPRLQIGMGQAG